MNRKRTRALLIAGALLALCLIPWGIWQARQSGRESAGGSARRGPSNESGSSKSKDEPAVLASRSGPRQATVALAPPADDKEVARFKRFFLPPMTFENATLQEAVARFVAVYHETAAKTGSDPQPLHIDLSAAATGKAVTCTTPRAPASAVLTYLAAMGGNKTTGGLPNFKLTALSDQVTPGSKGSVEVAPDALSLLKNQPDLLEMVNQAKLKQVNGNLTYENLSPADVEKLLRTLDVNSNGGIGPIQIKTSIRILDGAADLMPEGGMDHLTADEWQAFMRKAAETKGVDLVTMPSVTSRPEETANLIIDRSSSVTTADGIPAGGSIKASITAAPLGLSHETSVQWEMRNQGEEPVKIDSPLTIPDHGTGVVAVPRPDGRVLIVLPQTDLIDATGRPVGAEP